MIIKKKKIILVPYPAQGHVTPILKLAAVLSNLSFRPVIVAPEFIHRRISPRIADDDGILFISIPDGLPDDAPRDFLALERAMEQNMPPALESILREMIDGDEISCLVADLLASWSIEVARRCGVPAAGFWPAMHATYRLVAAIPQLIRSGVISENGRPMTPNASITLSSIDPILSTNDLPWLIGSPSSQISRFQFWTRTIQRAKTVQCIIANSFPDSQSNNVSSPRVLEVGSVIMQATNIANTTFWEEDSTCLHWLDDHDAGSVVYVSFGSWVSPIDQDKIKTLALTLEALGRPFLWVLDHAWRKGLPQRYANRIGPHGRIVSWAPQMEVLRHPAIGCYLCHCGWNSTMEAILCKKPLLCYPIAGDQLLNCRYIVDTWKIGMTIREFGFEEVKAGLERIVGNDEITRKIKGLNEQVFGKEGSSKAMNNLSTFIQDKLHGMSM